MSRPQVNDADRLVIRERGYLRHEQLLPLWHVHSLHSHAVLCDLLLGEVEGGGAMQPDLRQDLRALVGRDGPYTLTPRAARALRRAATTEGVCGLGLGFG